MSHPADPSPAPSNRWVAVGRSSHSDAFMAGEEAALEALRHDDAKLLVVFCSVAYDLDALLAGIRRHSAGVALIGCSTAGEIAAGGPGDAGVVVTALGGSGFSVATGVGRDSSTRLREAGADAAASAADVMHRPHALLIMLTDGLAGDQQEIVRGAYGVVGAGVPLVGGCAGDDLAMTATFQLHGDEVLRDAVVAAAVSSDAPLGIGVRHGWRRVGEPMLVTESRNNRVYAIDDRPALDVYLEGLQAPDEVRTDARAFTDFALTHPLGLDRRSGEDHVRFIGGADFEDRSLSCIAEVPQGALAWFMEGDADSVMTATKAACADALAALGEQPPLGMFAFDCIGRRAVLGDRGIDEEIEVISACAGGAPVGGFYTYGEIARTSGITGFHNETLVVLAVG